MRAWNASKSIWLTLEKGIINIQLIDHECKIILLGFEVIEVCSKIGYGPRVFGVGFEHLTLEFEVCIEFGQCIWFRFDMVNDLKEVWVCSA